MCPLRFILVFLSAVLAAYFAWTTMMRSSPEFDLTTNEELVQDKALESLKDDKQERSFIKTTQDWFWVFVDMASGRYLWRNFKEMNKDDKAKSC